MIVLHYTAMEDCTKALDWLCNPEAEVSAHYLIDRDGTLIQMVEEDMRAWHAGAGGWGGRGDVNSRSIGIELANTGAEPFAEPQMARLDMLLEALLHRWSIPVHGVIAHSDMAPGRKIDPGPRFDWARLARLGLAQATPKAMPTTPDPNAFETLLTQLGYPEAASEARLNAFRLRHTPRATGDLSATDMGLAQALVSSVFKYPN